MKKENYIVEWGYGYKQRCNSKTEALKIAADLLRDYKDVKIYKISGS